MAAIVFSLKDSRHRIDSELTLNEFAAIGYVTVCWAQLEHILLEMTVDIAENAKVPIPADATSLSFKKRLRALRALVKEVIPNQKKQTKLLDLLTKIGGAERSRNRITHGLWDWKAENPEKLSASSFRAPYHFEEPFDYKKLVKLAERIGEFNFQLKYPGGKKQAMKVLAQRGHGVGRAGMQFLQGRDISNIRPDLANLLTDNPVQSSSSK